MTAITPSQILLLYVWFPLAVVIAILLLIARYYQNFSGDPTHYRLYLVPLVLFGAGSVRYASIDRVAGDPLGDVLTAAAGLLLIILSLRLYHLMTAGRSR
ncbi:MAG: hypothetical protein CL610_02370 [Anaerolineaceae bacterium]|nr:hypothetical protein [Anaerolineaceae bacterium]